MKESPTRHPDTYEKKEGKSQSFKILPIATPFFVNSLFFIITALSLGGCSGLYFHNPQREIQAERAYGSFKAIRESASIEKLKTSFIDQRASEEELEGYINTVDDETQLSTLHDMTWFSLKTETENQVVAAKDGLKKAADSKIDRENELTEALNKLPLLQKKGATLLEAMNEAALVQARFEATQLLLRESLLLTLEKDTETTKTSVQDRLDKLLNKTTISVTNFSLNKSNQLENVQIPASISELLGIGWPFTLLTSGKLENSNDAQDAAKAILNNLKGKSQSLNLVLQDPGISVTILGFLQDVARAEEERTKVEIEYTRLVKGLLEANITFLEEYQTRLKEDLNPAGLGIASAFEIISNENDTVGRTLASLASRCQESPLRGESPNCLNLRALFRALEFNYQNRVIDAKKGAKLDSRLAALDSRRALDTVRVQVLEREAAISRGLDGLVAFHQGGIDENDVRNIIAIAQAIGVFVIAGGVY